MSTMAPSRHTKMHGATREGAPGPRRSGAASEARVLRRSFKAPLTLMLAVVAVIPVLYGLYLSLTDSSTGAFTGLSNYRELLGSGSVWHTVVVTVCLTAASVILTLALGTWLAFAMARIQRGQHFVRALLLLPLASAPIAVMYSWKTMLNSSYGVVNYLLGGLGIEPVAWYGAETPALISILVIDVWQWTAFAMVIVYGGLVSVPGEILEAAAVDGAGPFARLRYILVPAIAPYLLIALFFRAVDTLKIFDSIAVLTSGGPGEATTTMNWLAYRQMIQYLDFGKGTAAAILLLLVGIAFSSLLVRSLKQATREGAGA